MKLLKQYYYLLHITPHKSTVISDNSLIDPTQSPVIPPIFFMQMTTNISEIIKAEEK